MNLFARAVSDRRGHGVQVPQALDGRGGVDAAERAGEAVAVATGRQPDVAARRRLGTAAHYAFAGFLGVVYGLGRPRTARVSFAPALAYGTGAWMLADEGLMPALGLSRGPRELDYRVLAYGWLGHCVYAATMEAAISALENIRTSRGERTGQRMPTAARSSERRAPLYSDPAACVAHSPCWSPASSSVS